MTLQNYQNLIEMTSNMNKLLHMVLASNVRVKSIWTHSAPPQWCHLWTTPSGIGAVNREGTGGNLKRELSMESSLVEALSHSVMWNQFLSACFLRQCARNLRLRLLVCTNLYFDNFLSGANNFLYLLHFFFWPQRPSCTWLLGTFCISIDVTDKGITFCWWGFALFWILTIKLAE